VRPESELCDSDDKSEEEEGRRRKTDLQTNRILALPSRFQNASKFTCLAARYNRTAYISPLPFDYTPLL
jgi:hypothetical protein